MADKKPEEKPVEPKFHPEAPYPAPPMSDRPWSDEVEPAAEKKKRKED